MEGRIRRYEVCGDHDADYFGRGRFLSLEELERIRVDMVPAQVRDDATGSTAARPEVFPGAVAQARVREREIRLRGTRPGDPRETALPSTRNGRSVRRRSTFTGAEVAEIKRILHEKQTAPRDRQKALRATLRRQFRFYISEHSKHPPFIESDFDELIRRGTITIAD